MVAAHISLLRHLQISVNLLQRRERATPIALRGRFAQMGGDDGSTCSESNSSRSSSSSRRRAKKKEKTHKKEKRKSKKERKKKHKGKKDIKGTKRGRERISEESG